MNRGVPRTAEQARAALLDAEGGPAGDEAASQWTSAARIAEWLVEDYNGRPHLGDNYVDMAGWYFHGLTVGFNETIFMQLLRDVGE